MSTKRFPAPLDEKNVMTDWIEECFDNYGDCTCNGSRIVGFINNAPVYAIYYDNVIKWTILETFNPQDTMNVLLNRLDEHEDPDSALYSERMIDENVLYQSFFFKED